jgi:hypothetical protein
VQRPEVITSIASKGNWTGLSKNKFERLIQVCVRPCKVLVQLVNTSSKKGGGKEPRRIRTMDFLHQNTKTWHGSWCVCQCFYLLFFFFFLFFVLTRTNAAKLVYISIAFAFLICRWGGNVSFHCRDQRWIKARRCWQCYLGPVAVAHPWLSIAWAHREREWRLMP